jgi:hypothetical protein
MGRILAVLFIVYVFIHIFRLEMYPMYMFAMYSKKEIPRDFYHSYKVYEKDKKINLNDLDYRKYTVIMNTINQYDDILNNNMIHPETKAIDKFVDKLHLSNTGLKNNLKGSFKFSSTELKSKFGLWIADALHIESSDLKIEKEVFIWYDLTPKLSSKIVVYAVD